MIEFLEVEGRSIACWINDRGFREDRKNIVFVHGSGGNHTVWERQYTALEDDFNIVAVNLPGHGQSGERGEENITPYVEWVKKIAEGFSLKKPVIIGHSLGAAISLKFAIIYGNMLSGIVPVGGGIRLPVSSLIMDGFKKDPSSSIALISKFSIHKKNRELFMASLIEDISQVSPETIYGDLLACDRFDITGEIGEIDIPTLMLCGDDDKMTPPEYSKELKEKIKGAKLSLIKDSGHFVMMENAVDFNSALRDFVHSL